MKGLVVIIAFLAMLPAHAQGLDEGNAIGSFPEPSAPYDRQLLRLAEVLGSIHYLRNLCNPDEGNRWREAMSSILIAERPGLNRRERLIARFNRGYHAFNDVYSSCTASAAEAGERYRKEGSQLTGQITRRYGR